MEGRTRLIGWFTRLDIVIKGLVAQLKILAILLHLELVLIIIHPLFVLRSELRSVHRSIRKRVILFSSLEPLSIFQFCIYKINKIFLFLKSLLQFPNSSYEENPSQSNPIYYTIIWGYENHCGLLLGVHSSRRLKWRDATKCVGHK